MPLLRLLLAPVLLLAPILVAQAPGNLLEGPSEVSRPQDEDPEWAGTFDEAIQRARAMKKGRVFVELRTAECAECERMEKLIYPSVSFRAFMRDKVPVVLDRTAPEGQRLADRFGIRRVPAWLVLTPDLVLSGRHEGGSSQAAWMEAFVAAERGWADFQRKLDAEKSSPSDPAAAFAVGEEAFRRTGDEMAQERFQRVASDKKAPAELRDRSLAYLAAIALEARRFDDAEKALKQILATSKDPVLVEKAELRLADADIGRGERKKAAARLKTFLEKYPQSPMRKDVEALLEALGRTNP